MEIPKLNVWITFIIFAIVTCGWTLYASLHSLALIRSSPIEAIGYALGNALMIYYLVLVPSIVSWNHLKIKK